MPKGERNLILLILVLAVGGVVHAYSFRLEVARAFPLLWGYITAVLAVTYLVLVSVPALRERSRVLITDELFQVPGQKAQEQDPAVAAAETRLVTRNQRVLVALLVGFGLMAWMLGFGLAVPMYLIVMMRWYSRESWPVTIGVTIGTVVFLYLVFVAALQVPVHTGLLGQWLGSR